MQAKKSGNDARLIIKLIQGVYIELKADGTIEAFDSFLENPVGYTPGELCGKKWSDVFLPMETRPNLAAKPAST